MVDVRRVQVGDSFDICLDATPTAGFRWEVEMPPEADALLMSQGRDTEAARGVVGGSARQCFHFQALAPGQVNLHFRYGRPWEATVQEEKVVSIHIHRAATMIS